VELYFVETSVSEQRVLMCRYVDRLFSEGRKVQIVVDSTSSAQFVDQVLWTFSQSSFVPHAVKGPDSRDVPDEPVLIVIGEKHIKGFDVLLCDAPASLEFMCEFERAYHFILRDDTEKRHESRLIWQKARDSGHSPIHVPVGQAV